MPKEDGSRQSRHDNKGQSDAQTDHGPRNITGGLLNARNAVQVGVQCFPLLTFGCVCHEGSGFSNPAVVAYGR